MYDTKVTRVSYLSYADYVSELAKIDIGLSALNTFFLQPVSYLEEREHPTAALQRIPGGSVSIIDFFAEEQHSQNSGLNAQTFPTYRDYDVIERVKIVRHLNQVDTDSKLRLVFVSYYRDWTCGKYLGLDKQVLDTIALRFRLHPELLRLHFGSNYGLRSSSTETDSDDIAELPLLVQNQCVILRYGHGFLTACLKKAVGPGDIDTVVILARNNIVDKPLLLSRTNFLDRTFPTSERPHYGTNEIFINQLNTSTTEEIRQIANNPMSLLLSYGLVTVETEHFWLRQLQRIPNTNTNTNAQISAGNLMANYHDQRKQIDKIRSNQHNIDKIAKASPTSERARLLVQSTRQLTTEAEEQISNVRLSMNFQFIGGSGVGGGGISFASQQQQHLPLTSSSSTTTSDYFKHIKHANPFPQSGSGPGQDRSINLLTQLAFVFVPLLAMASIFSMNLSSLNAGTGEIWMFIVALLLAYGVVICLLFLSRLGGRGSSNNITNGNTNANTNSNSFNNSSQNSNNNTSSTNIKNGVSANTSTINISNPIGMGMGMGMGMEKNANSNLSHNHNHNVNLNLNGNIKRKQGFFARIHQQVASTRYTQQQITNMQFQNRGGILHS